MGRKTYHNPKEISYKTAIQKNRAAKFRNTGDKRTLEHSSEVYSKSCAALAKTFEKDGFTYAKSGPHFSKKSGQTRYIVSFQSSVNNIPDEYVALRMASIVRSKRLKEWRNSQSRPLRSDDWVAGGLVNRICEDIFYLEWDLSDKRTREDTLADVESLIRNRVLPWFNQFENPSELIETLTKQSIPAIDIGDSVEFASCYGSMDSAQKILDRFVQDRVDLIDEIRSSIERYSTAGIPHYQLTSYADKVAFLHLQYGFSILGE